MAVIIKQTDRFKYSVNGKEVVADSEGWYTSETLNADERRSWVTHFRSLTTTIKYYGDE
jgi:hypothetical protein